MSMRNLNGSGTLTTFSTPTVTIQASTTPISADIGLNGGTLQIGATGITQTFASTSTVTLFGNGFDFPGGNLAFLENSVFDAGAQLNRSVSLFFGRPSVAAGKTLTFQGGSDFNITGDYIFSPDCDIVVTGAGSQMVTSGSIFIAQSAVLSVQNGGLFNSGALDVGQTGSGDLFVNGPGSAMTVGARTTLHSGTVTFSNEAQVNCSPTSR